MNPDREYRTGAAARPGGLEARERAVPESVGGAEKVIAPPWTEDYALLRRLRDSREDGVPIQRRGAGGTPQGRDPVSDSPVQESIASSSLHSSWSRSGILKPEVPTGRDPGRDSRERMAGKSWLAR